MAGIFANVDSDISKLRQLKTEIENVKKALKSINVRVDIDIAQGLEAKLKSLTGQYDALVQKVSQAEGKIIASTQRINQAAGKIVKAQEQLAKATGVQSGTSAKGGAATAANQAETASVQAQGLDRRAPVKPSSGTIVTATSVRPTISATPAIIARPE